jgi:hypothetical protein
VLFTKLAEQDSALKRQVEGARKGSRSVGFQSHRAAQVFWYLDFIGKPAAKRSDWRGRAIKQGQVSPLRFLRSQVNWWERMRRRDRVLVDKLRPVISRQQNAEVVESGHEALKFDPVHQKQGGRNAVLAKIL